MTSVLKISLEDLSNQLIGELKKQFGKTAQLEIRVPKSPQTKPLFSESQFWEIIDLLNWSQETSDAVLIPAVSKLAAMPTVNIYLFADMLAEKLYQLDTRSHARIFTDTEADDYLSVDDFLYARCAVVAEGKAFFEKVLKNAGEMPEDLTFEPLLSLAPTAYRQKTGKEFLYFPTHHFETFSNREGWAK